MGLGVCQLHRAKHIRLECFQREDVVAVGDWNWIRAFGGLSSQHSVHDLTNDPEVTAHEMECKNRKMYEHVESNQKTGGCIFPESLWSTMSSSASPFSTTKACSKLHSGCTCFWYETSAKSSGNRQAKPFCSVRVSAGRVYWVLPQWDIASGI